MKYLYEKNKLEEVINNCSRDMIDSMNKNNAIIAGGAITSVFTNSPVNDLDLYFRTSQDMSNFLLDMEDTQNRIISYSDKALLITSNGNQAVQVITFKLFPTIKKLFKIYVKFFEN